MKKQKDKNKGNQGFTLVELLIAVAILAVIVTPILGSISASMRVNKKSDEILNETGAASTVMEGLSNQSFEDLAIKLNQQYTGPLDFLPTKFVGIAHTEIGGNSVVTVTPAIVGAGTPTPIPLEVQKKSTNVYVYGLQGIEYDGVSYDVKVTLDASQYYADTATTKGITVTPGVTPELHNDYKFVDLADFDKEQDGFYSEPSDQYQSVLNEFAVRSATMGYNKSADDFDGVLEREIVIDLLQVEKGNTGEFFTRVDVWYYYTVPFKGYVEDTEKARTVERKVIQAYINQKNDMSQAKPLRNFYMLYNPYYESTNASPKDKITIKNEYNLPVTVYLIKQNSVEDFQLNQLETNYHVDIETIDTDASIDNPTKIRTNIGYNLSNLLKENKYVSNTTTNQASLTFSRGQGTGAATKIAGNIYKDTEKITGESNDEVRIFKKKVEVYPAGAYPNFATGKPLTTLTSE